MSPSEIVLQLYEFSRVKKKAFKDIILIKLLLLCTMIYIKQHAIVSFQGYIFYQSTLFGGIKNLAQAKDSSQIGQQEKQYSSFNI